MKLCYRVISTIGFCAFGDKGEILKLWLWLKNLFYRKSSDRLTFEEAQDVRISEKEIATGNVKTFDNVDDLLDDLHSVPILVPKAGRQASRQDIGKFMKHGHQASWYRKSVKAKVQPEDED